MNKLISFFILLFITAIPYSTAAAIIPTLPQIYIQTPYSPPTGGQLFQVSPDKISISI